MNFFQTVSDIAGMARHAGPGQAAKAILSERGDMMPVLAVYVVAQLERGGDAKAARILERAIMAAGGVPGGDMIGSWLSRGTVSRSAIDHITRLGGACGASAAVCLHRLIDDDRHLERRCDFRRRLAEAGCGIGFRLDRPDTRGKEQIQCA